MPVFMLRVDLPGASVEEYLPLNDAMQRVGFARTMSASGGGAYVLPLGAFAFVGGQSTSRVLALAKQAVSTLGRTAAIIVVEAKAVAWEGLSKG
jgi:hypothetical protein